MIWLFLLNEVGLSPILATISPSSNLKLIKVKVKGFQGWKLMKSHAGVVALLDKVTWFAACAFGRIYGQWSFPA